MVLTLIRRLIGSFRGEGFLGLSHAGMEGLDGFLVSEVRDWGK